jgi:hypothetical protein
MASERIIIYYNDALKLLTDRNHNNNKNADDHNKIKYNNRNSNSSDIDVVKKINSVGNDSGNISSNLFSTKNDNKIIIEVKKLTIWLQKHQNETINDNMKIKLFTIIEMYYRYSLSIIMTKNYKVDNNSSSVSINKTKNNIKDQVILTTTITTTTTNNNGDDGSNNDNCAELLSDIILSLLTTYLQLPEGKLLNSKDKKKILLWLQSYNNNNNNNNNNGMTNDGGISGEKSSNIIDSNIWSVEEIKDDNTVTLLNKVNYELWKEDYNISNIHQYIDELKKMMMLRSSCGNRRSSGDGGENEVTDDHDNTNDGGIVYIELDELFNSIIRIVS